MCSERSENRERLQVSLMMRHEIPLRAMTESSLSLLVFAFFSAIIITDVIIVMISVIDESGRENCLSRSQCGFHSFGSSRDTSYTFFSDQTRDLYMYFVYPTGRERYYAYYSYLLMSFFLTLCKSHKLSLLEASSVIVNRS